MRIAYTIAGLYRPAGMERILTDKANALCARGHHVLVATTEQKGRPNAFALDARIQQIDLGVGYEQDAGKPFLWKACNWLVRRRKHRAALSQLLRRERVDVTVSLFCGDESFLPRLKDGSKKVLEVHFSRFKRLQYGRKGIWRLADKWLSRRDGKLIARYDAFVCLTEEDYAYWGHPANGHVIPNFVHDFPPVPTPMESPIVLGVGRLTHQKGWERLVAAWKMALDELPADCPWRLRLVGDGELREALEGQIHALGLTSRVLLDGVEKDMDKAYREASLLALSSRYEGLPMVLLEAQAHGLPIVAFDCKCGPREVVSDGEDGFLVPEGDIAGLAHRLTQLIQDRPARERMGSVARQRAERWRKDAIMDRWETLFQAL